MLAHKFADAVFARAPPYLLASQCRREGHRGQRSQPVREFHWSLLQLKLRHRVLLPASRYLPSRAGNAPKVVANQITVSRASVATGGRDLATGNSGIVRGASFAASLLFFAYILCTKKKNTFASVLFSLFFTYSYLILQQYNCKKLLQ